MGVTGAAVATTLGRGTGVAYLIVTLLRRKKRLEIRARHLRLVPAAMRSMLRISINASFQTLVETASWLGLVRILSGFGSAALAGYTIAIRVAIFALLPSWGLSNAAATLVGQNLGAREPDRAERSVTLIAGYNVLFLALVGLALAAVPGPIVRLFTDDANVIPVATECLRTVALGFLFYGYGMVAIQAFNGAGDTATPLWVNLGCFWLFKIPFAYLLAHSFGLGPRGVFIAITAAYTAQAFSAGLLFRRGTWKTRVLA
jgi:putative MATE family efflux protein